jgi:hypothetical protein
VFIDLDSKDTVENPDISRFMVRTKASAMPFDWGLSTGVVLGSKPMSRAKRRVCSAM